MHVPTLVLQSVNSQHKATYGDCMCFPCNGIAKRSRPYVVAFLSVYVQRFISLICIASNFVTTLQPNHSILPVPRFEAKLGRNHSLDGPLHTCANYWSVYRKAVVSK